jgi:indole-3-glycerol phosphate synthase
VNAAPGLLQRLVDEARAETAARRAVLPLGHLERLARALPPARDFAGALRRPQLAVLAELKARTPLRGSLCEDYVPGRIAAAYTAGGAAALSVLCQQTSFGGRPEHLAEARAVTDLPILRKDFVVDEYQVVEARAFGADAVLLIAATLEAKRLAELLALTRQLGMEALVEVHEEMEVEAAVTAGATVVGVNHRDLATFEVDLRLTERLRPLLPPAAVCVAESGVKTAADARRLRAAGADAVLVGEALMRAVDPVQKLRELVV